MCFKENLVVVLGIGFGGVKVEQREQLGGYCYNIGKGIDDLGWGSIFFRKQLGKIMF